MELFGAERARSNAASFDTKRTALTVLGATGSVGKSTLNIVEHHASDFEIVALTAHHNARELAKLARRHNAKLAVIGNQSLYGELKDLLAGTNIEVAAGGDALVAAAARPADCVMAAIVGAAGLRPTFEAAKQGRRLALANKECLVCAGDLFLTEAKRAGTELLPVDSEHSGVFQVIGGANQSSVATISLTASGGPFRTWELERLASATVEQALNHPSWTMGAKISIDSATLMNKGLELIEAHHLFSIGIDQLDVIVHPQSIVHCFVTFADGSVIAQLASPDMRTPISHALAFPERLAIPTKRLTLEDLSGLTFEAPDESRFPALQLARHALCRGGCAPIILNAANEMAVAAFLARRIGFLDIAATVAWCLEKAETGGVMREVPSLDDIVQVDHEARLLAGSRLDSLRDGN